MRKKAEAERHAPPSCTKTIDEFGREHVSMFLGDQRMNQAAMDAIIKEEKMTAIVQDPTIDHAGAMIKLMEEQADSYVPRENSNPFPKSINHLPSVASYFGGVLPSHM